jgi:hypothetical protein
MRRNVAFSSSRIRPHPRPCPRPRRKNNINTVTIRIERDTFSSTMERPLSRESQHSTLPVLESIGYAPTTGGSIGDSDPSGEDERYHFPEQTSGNGNGKRASGDSCDHDHPTKMKARNKYVPRAWYGANNEQSLPSYSFNVYI